MTKIKNKMPTLLELFIEKDTIKSTYKHVLKELVAHKNTYINKWGLSQLGVANKTLISNQLLIDQEKLLTNLYYQKNKNTQFCNFDLLSIRHRFFTRAVPVAIGFSWIGIVVKIKIKIEDHEEQRTIPVGEEIITNLENDIEESEQIITFHKNLVVAKDGCVELGDTLHHIITDDYSNIEYVIGQIEDRIYIQETNSDYDEDDYDEDDV